MLSRTGFKGHSRYRSLGLAAPGDISHVFRILKYKRFKGVGFSLHVIQWRLSHASNMALFRDVMDRRITPASFTMVHYINKVAHPPLPAS
jgi:hypothetical protein